MNSANKATRTTPVLGSKAPEKVDLRGILNFATKAGGVEVPQLVTANGRSIELGVTLAARATLVGLNREYAQPGSSGQSVARIIGEIRQEAGGARLYAESITIEAPLRQARMSGEKVYFNNEQIDFTAASDEARLELAKKAGHGTVMVAPIANDKFEVWSVRRDSPDGGRGNAN